ncbi:MAG: cysteine hydrolase family protein [Sporomusaceae bacterium]|nr:cysteine hydrolase family protein [Sporomusaceae bacterium]
MNRALLVIDVQNEYFTGALPVSYPENSFDQILKAIDTANEKNIPVILIRHGSPQADATAFVKNSFNWEIHSAVLERKHTRIFDKTLPGSFTGTDLEAFLRQQNIDTVTISGYMTQMCCDTTARQALHLGFSVEFLSDATGTLAIKNTAGQVTAEELHRAILVTQAMRFSQVLSTQEWINKLQ